MHLLLYHPSFYWVLISPSPSFTPHLVPLAHRRGWDQAPPQCYLLVTPNIRILPGPRRPADRRCLKMSKIDLPCSEGMNLAASAPPPLPPLSASILHSSIVSHHIVEQVGIALDHRLPSFPRRVTQLKRTNVAEVKDGLPSRRIPVLVAVILFRRVLMFRHVFPRFAVYIWTIIC